MLRIQDKLRSMSIAEPDEAVGVQIIMRALEQPVRQIAENAGAEGSVVIERIKAVGNPNFGYNAQADVYEDLMKAGVVDPTKVARIALRNAASIASVLLTTDCVMTDEAEDRSAAGAATASGAASGLGA